MFEQGDIVAVSFPFTNASQFKKRPALVISNNRVNQTGDYLLIQITSKVKNDGLSVNIEDEDYLTSVLPLKSYVRIHKIFLLNESLIIRKVSKISLKFKEILTQRIIDLID
ncbi:type II toxin-antitoxin system PemK/MazF family toxin [Mariniphaga sp.]|uniref:type II toxin-antitoxin system PemK/MazF family toxin n=1 Tax=Mariniphaga sp. TaxID=1954475 RepID=UPI0035692635